MAVVKRVVALMAGALTLLAACGGGGGGSGNNNATTAKVKLSLVAYSTPQAAYEKIFKAFQATAPGKNVTFSESFGASGDQSRAVEAGLPADVVAFSLEPDITRLVKAGIVAGTWNTGAHKGMVTDSVVVFVVRQGNPKHIQTWDDLTKPGIEVITPNPFTSGGARWNVMAAVGAKDQDYLTDLFKHVPVQDGSARAALQTFAGGKGDVMLAYENEAIFAKQNGQALDYVVPDKTILIENPVAVSAKSTHPQQAKAFLDFLYSSTAQRIFADNGYRPVISGVAKADEFKKPSGLFTIDDVGGWATVTTKFFDPDNGVMAGIERGLGVATKK